MISTVHAIISPQQTADALPYPLLAREIEALLQDPSVTIALRPCCHHRAHIGIATLVYWHRIHRSGLR